MKLDVNRSKKLDLRISKGCGAIFTLEYNLTAPTRCLTWTQQQFFYA